MATGPAHLDRLYLKLVCTNINYHVLGSSTAAFVDISLHLLPQMNVMFDSFVWAQSTCQERIESKSAACFHSHAMETVNVSNFR